MLARLAPDCAWPMRAPSVLQCRSTGEPAGFPSGQICAFGPSRSILRTGDAKRRPGTYAAPPLLGLSRSSQNSIAGWITLKGASGSSGDALIIRQRSAALRHIDHRFGKGLRGLLRQVVSDAAIDRPVRIFS